MKRICRLLLCMYACYFYAGALSVENMLIDSNTAGHKIELLFQKPVANTSKLILFLHGRTKGNGVRDISQSWFEYWLNKGYAIAAISMPGYGESTGKKDFCGPFTLASLHYAIDYIKNKLHVDNFGIIGFGQGGLAGTLLTSQRHDIRFLVCANGGYDLFRHRHANDLLITILQKEYDVDIDDHEALIYRSPMLHIDAIHTPVFLLHRKDNPIVHENEASDFCNAMVRAGKDCRLVVKDKGLEDDAQILSQKEILAEVEDWIDHIMHA